MAISDAIKTIRDLSMVDLDYEYRKLMGIREWAMEHLGIDYTTGDRVRIKSGFSVPRGSGWYGYREALAPGATATVLEIDYNLPHRFWYADIKLDREWTVDDKGEKRWWHGAGGETPDGFTPPSPYDQEQYPEGRRCRFAFDAEKLERVSLAGEQTKEGDGG